MDGNDCAGPLNRWTLSSPGPWAAVVWMPVMLASPAAELWPEVLAWTALPVVAVAFVAAVVTASRRIRRPDHGPDLLLAVQAVASSILLTGLPPESRIWIFTLLSIGIGAAADRRVGMWLIVPVALLAGVGAAGGGGLGSALAMGFSVLVSGVGTFSFYRLYEVIAELRRTREELALLAVQAERARVSRDLHDVLGHSLSLMVVKAEAVRRLAPKDLDAALDHASDIEVIGRDALVDVRRTVAGYRGDGVGSVIGRARESLTAADIRLDLDVDPQLGPQVLDDPVLGWVIREAVTNVVRHADARLCRISVRSEAGHTTLCVADDGCGVGDRANGGYGLTGLAERVTEAGGVLEIHHSTGGRGTEVVVSIPHAGRRPGAPAASEAPAPEMPRHDPEHARDAAMDASPGSPMDLLR
ncbi:MAG: sensor histidine kinase [Lapillicoccus sp.]